MNRATKLLAAMTMALVIICAGWVPGQDFSLRTASAATRVDDPSVNGANGSTAKPYIINEPGDFEWILSNWNLAGSSELMQTKDIDLTGYAWTPLDGPWSGFRGKYDGNGHTISNLLVDDSAKTYVGLFGRVEGEAVVKNITLVNANVTGRLPSAYIGGIVGMHNGGTIERCRVSGSVTGGNNDSVGGIAGYSGGTIRYSSSSATIVTGAYLSGNQPRAGGIVGMSSGTVQDSYNIGSVTGGASSCVGGIAGFGYAGTFRSCYNTGAVTGSGINTGSIIGLIRTTDGVSGNYYLIGTAAAGIGHVDPGDSSGSTVSNVGTVALSADQMKSSTNYSWSFTGNTWTIQGGVNNGYPTLKGVPTLAPTVAISGLTITTATTGGDVTAAGLGTVSERGVQRTKSAESTYTTVAAGSGTGSFNTQMSGLEHSTSYYVRAYATNEVGTAYGEPVVFTTKSLLSVTLSPGTEIGMTRATPTAAATSKFVVNITDASVGRVDADTSAPASGASFVDNYLPGADLSLGVQIGRYLQVYDVDGAGLIKNYAEVKLELQHIKQPPVLNVSVTPGDVIGSSKATITGAATSRFVLNISDSSFGQIVANHTAPASGEHLIANYVSGTAISSGVLKGRYLQIFDVDASNVIKGFYEVLLQAIHIKQPPFSVPYHEPFDDATMPSTLQWEAIDSGLMTWTMAQTGPYGETTRDGTGYMAFANSSSTEANHLARLSLNSDFAIPATATKAEFSFWMNHLTPVYGDADGNIQVQVSLDGGLTWDNLGSPYKGVVELSVSGDFEWMQHTLNLDALKGHASVRLGLLATSDWWFDLMVDDLDIVVEAPIVEYALAYAAGANGALTGSTSQTVQEGADGTEVVAVPNSGYHFVSWSDGVATAARTDRGVTGAINVTANFAANIAITVTADAQSKAYGAADPTLTYSLTSGALELGDSFSGALSREAGEAVGSYVIGKGTLSAGPKYDITFVGSSLTITKRSIEVTANSLAKTYGGADPTLTYGITQGSLVPGDEISGSLTRAVGEGVKSYQIGQGSLAVSANYELAFIPGTFTINPAALLVTAEDKAKTYGGANPALTATLSGFVLGQDLSVLGGTLTFTTPAVAGSGAGSYAISPSGLTSSNYAITYVDGTLTVNPAALTVTAGDKTKTYGSANPAFTATYSGFVLGQDPSVLGGALSFVTPASSSSGVGTYAITPAGLTSSNYAITFHDGTLTVNPASLTVTADGKSKPYGSANPAFTATYSGFVLGHDPSVLGGALVFVTPATSSTGVGTYAINPTGLTSSNYAITFVDGTLTVSPALLTVTANDKSKTYGNANPAFSATYNGFVLGQDSSALGGALTFTTPATVNSGAGAYAVTPSGLTSSNYAITFVDGTLTVNPAALIVTAEEKSKVYGDANPAFTATYTGFVLGQDVSVLGGALTFTTPAVAGSDVGTYDITPSGLTSSNYAITFVDGTLTVTPAALTVSADNKSKTYGQPNPASTASYTGFVAGDGPSALGGTLAFVTPAGVSSGVGSYPVTPSGLTSSNYTITFVGGILQVNPAALTVTADDKARTYGSENPALTVSYSGFVLGQDSSALGGALALVTTATASSDVGAYPVTPSGLTSGNYAITFVDGTLTVNPAGLTVTAEDKSKSYGSDNPAFTAAYSGFVLGQDSSVLGGTLTFATPATNGSNVGSYAITPSGLTSGNYAVSFVNGTLQVTPAALTVRAESKAKTYGDANPAFTAAYSGFVLGQGPAALGGTLTFTTPATTGSGVGTYAINPTGLTSSNYAITFVNGQLQVNQALLTVKAEDKTRAYGQAEPAFTVTYSGFVLAQTQAVLGGTLNLNTEATVSSGVGIYSITPSGLTSSNYAITFVDGVLQVEPALLTVAADMKSKVYGEADPVLTYRVTAGGLVNGDSFSGIVARALGENVGSYAITQGTLSAGSNYELTFVGNSLTISKRPITVTADAKTKVYGDADPALTCQISSGELVGSDAFQGGLTRDSGENVGNYAIQQGTLDAGSNYELTYVGKHLSISKRPVTVTADARTKVYGDADPALTYQISSGELVGSDAFLGSLTREPGENVGNYAIQQGTLDAGSNYELTYVGKQVSISKRPVTVTADAKTKVYGESDPALTYQIISGELVGSDSFQGGLTRDLGENVGNYAIKQGTLDAGSNYELTYVGKNLSISKRPITVTADAKTKVYGDADPALTYQVTGGTLAGSDAFQGGLTREPGENVGSYAITQDTLSAGSNYELTFVGNSLTISKRPITVTADAKTKVYGDADPVLTYQVTVGTLAGSDAFLGSLTREPGENVGSYAIQQGTLDAGPNYELTFVGKNLSISERLITVTADAKTKVYGEDDPALTYQLTSGELVGEDAFQGGLARAPGRSIGEYEIQQNDLTAGGNYRLTYVSAELTITAKQISAAGIAAQSKYWDGVTAVSLSTIKAGLVGVETGDDVQLDVSHASGAFADADLGVNKLVTVTGLVLIGTDAGNYQLSPYTTTASIIEEPAPPKPPTPPTGNGGVAIIVNGETQDDSATATTSTEGDKTVTTVVIDPDKLDERLEEEGENSTVTVPVNTGADVVVGELTGQTVKNMETKSAVLEIKTERVTYTLPASQISIDNVASQLGEAVSLQDVKVSVQVAEPPANTVKIVEDTANRNSYQVVVKPVEFTITCTHADKTVEVSKFNGYVERMVAVPEGVDPSKITTGVVLNADGTFSHVPTTIVKIDGKYYAKINSLTNSVYSVIWNPIEFQDMNGHWAKGPANDMGSRLVMEGESSEVFGPKKAITRGEFAATIVKALGLRPETGESPFVDLQASHKHYGYILTAYQYHIMGGLPGNKFGADSELTREEAMAIVVSAMRLTKLSSTLSAAEVNTTLVAYNDRAHVSGWARNVVAACLKSGIIGGRPGQLIAPKDIITRAEAAAIMQRFLHQAGLI